MLTRTQLLLYIGALLLAAALIVVTTVRRMHRREVYLQPSRRALRAPGRALSLLRRCLSLRADSAELHALHSLSQPLTESILRLQRELRSLPGLPLSDGEARLMALARRIASGSSCTAPELLKALSEWDVPDLMEAERMALPYCVALAHWERLCHIFRTLLSDEHERHRGDILADKLPRIAHPLTRLNQQPLSLTALHRLLSSLRAARQDMLLEALDGWLQAHDLDAEEVAARAMQRQLQIIDDLRAAAACLDALRTMDWQAAVEAISPLHQILLGDPSGIYARMTLGDRSALRMEAEKIARAFSRTPKEVAAAAVECSAAAEPRSLEQSAVYYLLDAAGVRRLHRALSCRRGRFYCFCRAHPLLLQRLFLWGFSIMVAFPFLHADNPLLLLPAFLVVIGCIPRALLRYFRKEPTPPAMELHAVTPELRTLVVLPAQLHTPEDALRALRSLKAARHAFPENGVDCMLLADYAPSMTQRSAEDGDIIATASAATAALCKDDAPGRYFYLHRARRQTDGDLPYAARGARSGAIETLCRLIAQGECADWFDFANISPAGLHRRYAFILALDPQALPAPGMLEALLAAASHPLNTRFPTPDGFRGFSCFRPIIQGKQGRPIAGDHAAKIRLIRPDAYLESLADQLSPEQDDSAGFLSDALSGCAIVGEARAFADAPVHLPAQLNVIREQAIHLCRMGRWLLPWVNTPFGLLRAPLPRESRFQLREKMRACALPLCQLLLLLLSLLRRDLPLMLLTLIAPMFVRLFSDGPIVLSDLMQQMIRLPARTAALILGALSAFLPRLAIRLGDHDAAPHSALLVGNWSQGIATLVALAAGLTQPFWIPALLLAAIWGLIPLLPDRKTDQGPAEGALAAEDELMLREILRSTWTGLTRFQPNSAFSLPPDLQQTDPPAKVPAVYTPPGLAMRMLSAVSAKETGLIDASTASGYIRSCLSVLSRLPMPRSLPCRRYFADDMRIADEAIDAVETGLLLTALMTCAQAIRTWLPELPSTLHGLSAQLDGFAASLDAVQLYDAEAGLFRRGFEPDGTPLAHVTNFTDTALLLSIATVSRREIPPSHFLRLSRTAVHAGDAVIPLSRHGDLAAYLLPALFLPLNRSQMRSVVRLHQLHGMQGLWGRAESAAHAFTPDLAYRQDIFGLRAIAAEDGSEQPVFAPYAAALALTCAPDAAVRCLRAMQQLGAFSPNGFYDAVDLSSGTAQIVRTHIALHQGILLCASAHVLADAPLMRFFCAIPAVEATLPLLHAQSAAPLTLPPRPIHAHAVPAYVSQERTADTSAQPVDAHLMGSDGASLAVTASGSSLMQLDGLPVTRFSGLPGELDGLQIYLIDESGAYRVTDPALPGKTTFSSGFARFIRRCGSLQTTLTLFHDPVHKRFFHLLEVTNLATADRTIELADFLWGDLGAAADTLEASRPEPYHACLADRASGTTLHHRIALSQPPASTCLCTDGRAFLGRGRTLADPASLEEPMADLTGSSCASCLSFRIQAVIGGRGQLRMLLSTALNDAPLPTWQELPGCMTLSTLHARAIAEAIPLPPPLEAAASRAVGATLWRGQAHQGARSPVDAALLKELLLPEEPLVSIAVPDESSLPRLTECLAIAAWFFLHGCPLTLYLLCSEETAPLAEAALHDAFPTRSTESMAHILTDVPSNTAEALFAASRFVLRGSNRSLTAQLDSLRRPIPLPQRPQAAPEPGELPSLSLAYCGSCGGFEPDTGDYCLQLAAHQTTPLSWPIHHAGDGFAFTADENGFLHPFGERLSLSIDGSAPIPLPGSSLPRSIRIGNGLTRWRVHARDFRATLTAGCIVGAAAGLRSVHIRNLTDAPFACVLTVSAAIGSSPLHCLTALDDAVVVENCIPAAFVAAAEGDWKALCSDDPHNACGRCAVLRASFALEAHASADMAWIAGTLQELEELAKLQLTLHQQGISATLRQRAQTLAAALQPLTASTPEPTLDLLVNHLLPRQLLASGSAAYPPAVRMLFSPPEARSELLQTLGASALSDERLLLTMQVCRYVECTGDVSIFSASVADGVSIADMLREDLLQIKLDKASLPVTDDAVCTVFMAAVAAGCLAGSAGDSALTSHRLSLLNAADTLLWHTDHYGVSDALRLDVQAWAALAYGDTPRTKRCLRACLDTLCDREQGVLRLMRPTDAPACPGTPGNGGQSTRAAVLFLAALLKVGMHDSAWELLRMLNPIHHCDDPLRSEVYQGAPWFLSDGLHAAPSEAGRSTNVPDDRSAAWLEEIIMTRMLGLTRSGDQLRMAPIVPPDWDDFCITLQIGSATWRIECSRDTDALLVDGVPSREGGFCPADDGRIHHIRCPIT